MIVKVHLFEIRGELHALIYDEHAVHQWAGLARSDLLLLMGGATRRYFYADWSEADKQFWLHDEAPSQPW